MRRVHQFCLLLSFLLLTLPPAVPAQAPSAAPELTVDPAVAALALRLVDPIQKAHAKRVAILDLLGPQRELHPVGKWIADQLALALQKDLGDLQIVDRNQLHQSMARGKAPDADQAVRQWEVQIARDFRADVLIDGTYAQLSARLGLTLNPIKVSRPERPTLISATIPITPEITSLSQDPIPVTTGDFPRAGVAGTSLPSCIYCPDPEYSPEARKAGWQGTVVLDVVVTAAGTVERIIPIKGPALGIEEKAVEAVRKWRLKPALDVDGHPTAVRIPIEITFRFFRR